MNHSHAAAAATKLGVPHPAAVVGFETRNSGQGSRKVPTKCGIVVLSEHAIAVRNAAEQLLVQYEEITERRREKALLDKWTRVVRGVLLKEELREKYMG